MPSNVFKRVHVNEEFEECSPFLRLFNKEACIVQKRSIHTNWLKLYLCKILDREEPKEGQISVFQRSFQAHYL